MNFFTRHQGQTQLVVYSIFILLFLPNRILVLFKAAVVEVNSHYSLQLFLFMHLGFLFVLIFIGV